LALGWLGALGCARLLPGSVPTPAPTPEVIADCFWSVQVYAWVDEDGDGAPDEGEPPLEGVQANFSLTFLTGGTTDANGVASVLGMYPSACDPDLANQVVATAPEGYAPTTEPALPMVEGQSEYAFGFRLEP
jgi:hypothetical protein